MMKMLILQAAFAIVLLATAHSEELPFNSGNAFAPAVHLLARNVNGDLIKTADDERLVLEASSYIKGFIDMWSVANDFNHNLPFKLPDTITVKQIAKIVDKYFDAHPERLHNPAAVLVMAALAEAFPNPAFNPNSTH